MKYPVEKITVNRAVRQRKIVTTESIDRMAVSFEQRGQITPISITKDGVLLAGETRLMAAIQLGWKEIEVTVRENVSAEEAAMIELEENIVRTDLPWQDQVDAFADVNEIMAEKDPEHSTKKLAAYLGYDERWVQKVLRVHKELHRENSRITEAKTLTAAANIVSRAHEREVASQMETAMAAMPVFEPSPIAVPTTVLPVEEVDTVEEKTPLPFLNVSFLDWSKSYSGPKFNCLHCDFPYGVRADIQAQGSAAAKYAAYDDTFAVFEELTYGLADCMNTIISPSAHMIFWFSMDYYSWTKAKLEAMGWSVSPFPLIWHKSDNTGMLPDPNRQPRRTYETAFFCTRGDRKLVGPKANSFACPGRDKSIHRSEKHRDMLTHFLSMVVDEHSVFLDPTAGSGNAVKVAQELNASQVLGLEIDEEIFQNSVRNW